MFLMRQYAKAILILLLAAWIPCSQAVTLAASHSLDHSSHCCVVCHTGHLSIESAGQRLDTPSLAALSWRQAAEEPARAPEPAIVLGHSRAPPA
jgi:hypothetical protein